MLKQVGPGSDNSNCDKPLSWFHAIVLGLIAYGIVRCARFVGIPSTWTILAITIVVVVFGLREMRGEGKCGRKHSQRQDLNDREVE